MKLGIVTAEAFRTTHAVYALQNIFAAVLREIGRYECFFFFQAEDGIRDIGVTGVQTCALPISRRFTGPTTSAPCSCVGRGGPSPRAPTSSGCASRGSRPRPTTAPTPWTWRACSDRKSVV